MNLSKITFFKKFIYLFIFSLLITSCDPEEVPKSKTNKGDASKIFLDSGDEENPPETKD